ncbi:MAG: trimeric intracellular cation channel family protein [Thermomicrobiales bacterium]
MDTLLVVLDLTGTFVFALSGAVLGVRKRLDLFGVLVLSFAAATGGGILRDVLIGAVPPAAIDDWRYAAVSFIAGIVTFYRFPVVTMLRSPVMIFDAAGLALFTVAGSLKALDYDLDPMAAVLLGVLTGIGGGVVRDMLVARVPSVLHSELYAMAAALGATVVVIGDGLGLPVSVYAPLGGMLCFLIRLIAIRSGWRLPIAPEYGKRSL